jgi:membrane associated rhomboid family serine protease
MEELQTDGNMMDEEEEDVHGPYPFKRDDIEESKARDENFFTSLSLFCCPKLTWLQFISIISILEVIVYIISLSVYGVSNESFLAPDYHGLRELGAADAKSTKNDY